MNFTEEFLHFIWRFRLYGSQKLFTTNGEYLEVIRQGVLNTHAGPDFSNAKLLIGNTIWVGNIEIHLKASDWMLHQHHFDEAYENVILHVVYEHDCSIYRKDGTLLPVLIIKDLFPNSLFKNYEQLITAINEFPCEHHIRKVDGFLINNLLSKVMVERMLEKSIEIEEKLLRYQNDWDTVFYHFLAKNFGFKVNAIPMEMLAQSLPRHLFAKHKDQPLQIEALIFGQAGFLQQKFKAHYPNQLKQEYLFLQKKYKLKPIDCSLWKFLRMRPQNFPMLRLAQFAALIVNSNHLFSKLLAFNRPEEFAAIFLELPVHSFWTNHYHFNKEASQVNVQLGKTAVNTILTNMMSQFLFVYGKTTDQYIYVKNALDLLEKLPPEDNAIIRKYASAGVSVTNAFDSQALLQLKRRYCNEKKCLSCMIGIKILNK